MSRPPRPLDAAAAERLRSAAADAFARKGLDGASLNDILTRAGMGKGSFYHWFADKGALHDWVVRDLADALGRGLQAPDLATLTAASFRPELSAMLARFSALAGERAALSQLGLMFHNSVDAPDERVIARIRAAGLRWIDDAVQTGRALGVIRTDLPADLLCAWTIASLTTLDRWVLTTDAPGRERAAATALDALWTLLTPPPA